MHTMNNARMEKAYRHWGHDISDEDTPLEAGLGFAIDFDKKGGFIGRRVLEKHRQKNLPLKKRLVALALLDDSAAVPLMYHEEPIYCGAKMVGSTTSGAWGHRIGKSLGLGYVQHPDGVTAEWLSSNGWEVELGWRRYPVKLQLHAFYDPKGERTKA
jgi:4-methylaminobutanoate oxidase (formaldehyde-forming)